MNFVIPLDPRTKKNSQQIVRIKGFYKIIPSKAFKEYQDECCWYIPKVKEPINYKINLKCIYYLKTRRKCDLNNLLEATTDILVHYGFLEDDNYNIVFSHDGSCVYYDKKNPRCEIEIKKLD